MFFFLKEGWQREKNRSSWRSVIFSARIMNTFKKSSFSFSAKNFLSKNENKTSRAEGKKLQFVRCCHTAFFRSVFLEKRLKMYNNERQKILRLRNSNAEEFVGFLFFEKNIKSTAKKNQSVVKNPANNVDGGRVESVRRRMRFKLS